jgi:hypothetical protein
MSNDAGFNPYASPQITTAPARSSARKNRLVPYESGHARAAVALVAGAVWIAMYLVSLGSHAMQYSLLQRMALSNTAVPFAEIEANDARQQTVQLAVIAVALIASIAYYTWLHRAYRNLPALGAQRLEQTPGWAIGYYFIPILSLFKPHQGMKEIVRGSDPDGVSLYNGMGVRGGAIVGLWWGCFIIDLITAQMVGAMAPNQGAPATEYMANTGFAMVHICIAIATVALTAYLVWRVDRWQTERSELLENFAGDPQANAPLGTQQPDWAAFNFDQ